MIYHVDSVGAKCDGCGVDFEDANGLSIFADEIGLRDSMDGDWIFDDEKCYCYECGRR